MEEYNIIEAVKKEVFNKRKNELKSLKKLATIILNENLLYNKTAKGWQKKVVEKNIFNLKNIITDINIDQNKDKIGRYVELFLNLKSVDTKSNFIFTPEQSQFIG